MGDTKNVLRDTGNEDGMNLEEVARDLNTREVLVAVEVGPWRE